MTPAEASEALTTAIDKAASPTEWSASGTSALNAWTHSKAPELGSNLGPHALEAIASRITSDPIQTWLSTLIADNGGVVGEVQINVLEAELQSNTFLCEEE